MATFHENLVTSFTNFKNKYIVPLNNDKANKTSVPASITRSGTSFSAKNSDGTEIFTFDQQDNNTWRGIQDNLNSTSTAESLSANQGYVMSRDVPWYGTSSTAASTIAKTATTSDGKFALTTGAKVSIKFTYDNTASAPTLNVDSTGAKSIKAYGTTAPTSWWQAGDVVNFTYDGTNWIIGATEGQISQINSDLSKKIQYVSRNNNSSVLAASDVDGAVYYELNNDDATVLLKLYDGGHVEIVRKMANSQTWQAIFSSDTAIGQKFINGTTDALNGVLVVNDSDLSGSTGRIISAFCTSRDLVICLPFRRAVPPFEWAITCLNADGRTPINNTNLTIYILYTDAL